MFDQSVVSNWNLNVLLVETESVHLSLNLSDQVIDDERIHVFGTCLLHHEISCIFSPFLFGMRPWTLSELEKKIYQVKEIQRRDLFWRISVYITLTEYDYR